MSIPALSWEGSMTLSKSTDSLLIVFIESGDYFLLHCFELLLGILHNMSYVFVSYVTKPSYHNYFLLHCSQPAYVIFLIGTCRLESCRSGRPAAVVGPRCHAQIRYSPAAFLQIFSMPYTLLIVA